MDLILVDLEILQRAAGYGNRIWSFRYTPLLLERDELPELQSKEVKREELRDKKAQPRAASRFSTEKTKPGQPARCEPGTFWRVPV